MNAFRIRVRGESGGVWWLAGKLIFWKDLVASLIMHSCQFICENKLGNDSVRRLEHKT